MMPHIMTQIVNPIIEDVEDSTDSDESVEDEELEAEVAENPIGESIF